MSDRSTDPGGNTDQFRAFVQREEPKSAPSRTPLYVGGAAVALIVLVVIVLLLVL